MKGSGEQRGGEFASIHLQMRDLGDPGEERCPAVRVSCEVRAVLKLHPVGEPAAARKGMKRRREPWAL